MLHPRTTRTNRYGLAVIGMTLLAGGIFALGQSQNLWLAHTASDPLLVGSETRYTHAHTWLWILAAIVAAVLALGCIRWLLNQARRADLHTLRLETDPAHGQTTIPAHVIARAIETDLTQHPGINAARVEITGQPASPTLRITTSATDPQMVSVIRRCVETDIPANARALLDLPDDPPVYLTIAIGR
jgi:hypothetical protein